MAKKKRKVVPAPVPVPIVKIAPVRGKTKIQAKTRVKGKRAQVRATEPKLDQVPVAIAPPDMEDTRLPSQSPRPKVQSIRTERTEPSSVQGAVDTAGASAPYDPSTDPSTTPTKPKPEPTPRAVPLPSDSQLVQGATCTWIGALGDAPDDPTDGIPVCPHCGGHLLTSPDRNTVELGFEQFELGAYPVTPTHNPRPHPGYREFMRWLMGQGKCWPDIHQAADAYQEATGKRVDPGL